MASRIKSRTKFSNVDILAFMGNVVQKHTRYYQSDFEIDKEILHRAAEKQEQRDNYTQTQIKILRRLIQQKEITEQFFNFLLESLFELKDWKQLNYKQMYELIHVLTFYNYEKRKV